MPSFSFPSKIDTKTPVVLPLYEAETKKLSSDAAKALTKKQGEAVAQAMKTGVCSCGILPVYSADALVLLLFLKDKKNVTTRDAREAGMGVVGAAAKYKCDKLTVLPGTLDEEHLKALREGVVLGGYEYTDYKGVMYKEAQKKKTQLKTVQFAGKKFTGEDKYLSILEKAVSLTKDIINCPPMEANPDYMEKQARTIAKLKGVKVTVFKEKELKQMKCNGILTVGMGSHVQSRLIVLEYKGGGKEKPIALVGKGVTYDTGGYSLKPSQYMETMKQDLGGAATVMGAFYAIAASGVKKNVLCVVPSVENSVNSYAYKPDDIIRMYNGVTVEVTNTDAEGRLILADALAYTAKKYEPRAMLDLATLTGACAYAVGNDFTAILGTDDKLTQKIIDAGEKVDEALWQLPLHQRYKEDLKSSVADIVNSSRLKAGTIEGGLFLQHFVPEKTSWSHLDIASVAFDDKKKLATGRNVRMLWQLAKDL